MTKYPNLEALVNGSIVGWNLEIKNEVMGALAEIVQLRSRVEQLETDLKAYKDNEWAEAVLEKTS